MFGGGNGNGGKEWSNFFQKALSTVENSLDKVMEMQPGSLASSLTSSVVKATSSSSSSSAAAAAVVVVEKEKEKTKADSSTAINLPPASSSSSSSSTAHESEKKVIMESPEIPTSKAQLKVESEEKKTLSHSEKVYFILSISKYIILYIYTHMSLVIGAISVVKGKGVSNSNSRP